MTALQYTLIADGSSDRALIPIITWALRQRITQRAIQPIWADLSRVPRRPQTLTERITEALNLYPCDLLCVHRDAERERPERRREEIMRAVDALVAGGIAVPPVVCVIPVRMQEAWLLFDEAAIRSASGNPNGRIALELPHSTRIERLPDPKEILRQLVRQASELRGKRLARLDDRPQRVADFIEDFAPLRHLTSFQTFEAELSDVISANGWDHDQGEAPDDAVKAG